MITRPDIARIETLTGYIFKDPELAVLALTHPSWSGEMKKNRIFSNQRLEFLGDAVLELVVSEYLYKTHPDIEEGELTRLRSSLVFETALCVCAEKISLGEQILLGKGEEVSGGREKPSILSDAFEALIGAVYLDGGFAEARQFVERNLLNCIDEKILLCDAKSMLQEYVQSRHSGGIRYDTESFGEGAEKCFRSVVYINEQRISEGRGHSKKTAEQDAAKNAVEELKICT